MPFWSSTRRRCQGRAGRGLAPGVGGGVLAGWVGGEGGEVVLQGEGCRPIGTTAHWSAYM